MTSNRYLTATAATGSTDAPLSHDQIQQWRSAGFTLVSGLLDPQLVAAVTSQADAHYPEPNSTQATAFTDFGSAGALTFPTQQPALNQLTLAPALLNGVAQLLDIPVPELRLTQSDLWPKYGRTQGSNAAAHHNQQDSQQDNQDQRIHVDYPNHTLAHPSPWHRPDAVEMIVYYSDHADTGGATAVVPRQGPDDPAYRWPIVDSPGIGDLNYINNRDAAEQYFAQQRPALTEWRKQLYARECYTAFKPGDVLLYRHDTWHRGTPMLASSRRLVHNLTYRKAAAEWYSTLHIGWAWSAYRNSKFLERLIAQCTLDQRAVLGFPQPNSEYWCAETIAAVGARYAPFGMDMKPYLRAQEQRAQEQR